MTEKKKPKVIILDQNDDTREHAQSILIKEGWDVFCEQFSKDALERLAQAKKAPFALFICNDKLPKMDGDDILQEVKIVSPLTQRMLLVPVDKLETLISAIHKAQINACITAPFKDKDLIFQTKNCFKQFILAKKYQHFKMEILHKNKQMLQNAQNLKKKDEKYSQNIKKKKQVVLKLKSEKRELENKQNGEVSLENMIEQKEIQPSQEVFQNEFIAVSKTIKNLFDKLTSSHDSKAVTLDFKTILHQEQNEEQNNDSDLSKPIKKIITAALTWNKDKTSSEATDISISETSKEPFEISFSENNVKAYLKKNNASDSDTRQPTLADILELLQENQISYGIVENITIESWIDTSFIDKILIATGEEPVHGSPGKIKYHFEIEFTNPGKINEDGSIDFKDRGDIPFVNEGDVLAVKTPIKESKSGINVSGEPIQVEEIIDPVFTAGPGTQISEDELTIHAAIGGQPNLDAMGTITVNPELSIPGDVDFETGNIDFKGNIVVNGMVKEGFTIKGVNLTAKEIEGAFIELSGDLNVSAGITDSKISTQGNIHAKFINHSKVMAFGDLEISKEILDSDVILSGSCQNPAGHILTSNITAKMGIEAGKIGTPSAKPSRLNIGVDKHMDTLTDKIQESLTASVNKADLLRDNIKTLEDEDQELYKQVSEKAHIQDRAQLEIKELKNSGMAQSSMEILKLEKQAKLAELELNKIFEAQDKIAQDIDHLKEQVNLLEEKNKTFMLEKKALQEFSKKERPKPIVTIAQSIAQDTIIKGPYSSMILKNDASRCKIQ
ncbi:MAG: DUF342 domain-containing protein, partial [Desulfobacula sp.]|nr:DUF342 domain-containing protein [Desulfobacula sp.]